MVILVGFEGHDALPLFQPSKGLGMSSLENMNPIMQLVWLILLRLPMIATNYQVVYLIVGAGLQELTNLLLLEITPLVRGLDHVSLKLLWSCHFASLLTLAGFAVRFV